MSSVYRPPMTEDEFLTALRPRLTPEFLATLLDLACGYSTGDYMEIDSFVLSCYTLVGATPPDIRAYSFTQESSCD